MRQRAPVKEGAIRPKTAGAGIMRFARNIVEADHSVGEQGKENGKELSDEDANGGVQIKGINDVAAAASENENDEEKKNTTGQVDGKKNGVEGKSGGKHEIALSEMKVVFDETLGKDKRGKRLLRYQLNPRANWGPMSRAKGQAD